VQGQAPKRTGARRQPPKRKQVEKQKRSEADEWFVEGSADRRKPPTPRWTVGAQNGATKRRASRSRAQRRDRQAADASRQRTRSQPRAKEDRASRGSGKSTRPKRNGSSRPSRTDALQWLSDAQPADSVESNSDDNRPRREGKGSSSSRRPRRGRPKAGRVDLNTATFEELRALNLSVTQSARLIAQRETRGGFRSVDELDSLYGFPRATLAMLKQRAQV
jgi:hypothetical protein